MCTVFDPHQRKGVLNAWGHPLLLVSSSSRALIGQSSPAADTLQGLDSMRVWNRVYNFIVPLEVSTEMQVFL